MGRFSKILLSIAVICLLTAVFVTPVSAEGDVAKIGDKGYETVTAALTEAQVDDTITLLAGTHELITLDTWNIKNLTITAEEETVVKGIAFNVIANNKIDGLRLTNIDFQDNGVYFILTNQAYFTTVKNLTMDNCTFKSQSTDTTIERGNRLFDVGAGSTGSNQFENIVIKDCTVNGGTQGIRLGSLYGINEISGNTISGIGHNAINLGSVQSGSVTVSDNEISNGADRAFRATLIDADVTITFKDNTITNTGDDDDSNYKANTVSGTVTFIGNTVDGVAWPENTAVAKVGTTEYTTLKAAVEAAAESATITLLNNADLTDVTINKALRLELGRYELVGDLKVADDYRYSYENGNPKIIIVEKIPSYTITWKWNDGTNDVTKTTTVKSGEVPVYPTTEEPPSKTQSETHTFTFNGWKKENGEGITAVAGETTYIAQFIETKIQTPEGGSGETEESKTEAVQPIVPVAPVVTEDEGKTITTIVTNTGSSDIKVAEDKKSATIEAKNTENVKVATITVSFADEVGNNGDEKNSVTGEITQVTISYETKAAESTSTENTNNVEYTMDLTVKTVVTDLPKIESSIQQEVVKSVKEDKPELTPLAMITATNTDAINKALEDDGGKITLTFTVPKTAIKDVTKIRVLHVKGTGVEEATIIGSITEDPANLNNWKITAEGTSFSSYVLVEEKTVVKDSGSSSQGSSIWLQEPAIQQPTEQPTDKPTDAVPTDIPTTKPTEEAKTPLSVLAVLGGLGVVAVMRRK